MGRLEMFDFQQEAVDQIFEGAMSYFLKEPNRLVGERKVPFVGQIKAVTGAGKTPILASVVHRLKPSIILWTTKFGSVVDQTVSNLSPGGKYHHLISNSSIEIVKFSSISSVAQWRHILDRSEGITILVSTVAAWNSSVKDDRLNVHRGEGDWGKKSLWEQLKTERKRVLWIVYDEAHNTTTEQVELLDNLDPAGFFVASASPLRGKLQQYLLDTPIEQRKQQVVPISTQAVVNAQLLKSTISLADYDSSIEEMIFDVVKKRDSIAQKLLQFGTVEVPKAIYVVETSNVTLKESTSRPATIWKTLVSHCNVSPDTIAICTNTKDLPRDAHRVDSIQHLSDQYTHIIFNKKLQEGWDDPLVYVCYFDGRTNSVTRISQVLGRALRQPSARHFPDEDLNTAYFFVNCPSELLEQIIDDLKEELRIYKSDDDADNFEAIQVRAERTAPPKIPLKEEWIDKLHIPSLSLELPIGDILQQLVGKKTYDFSDEDRSAPGRALVNIVSIRTGEVTQNSRDLFEDMRVRCGLYLQEQIRVLSRNCVNSMHPSVFINEKLNKTACYKSKALEHYKDVAVQIVREYENHVQFKFLEDCDPNNSYYTVGNYQPSGGTRKDFEHAGHLYYDVKSFNTDEQLIAKALDKFAGYVWVRNKDRLGFGIPLPVKSGTSSTFYPDFLWWIGKTIWAIDPTNKILWEDKLRTKMLVTPSPLKVAIITRGKPNSNEWTLMRHRLGNSSPESFETLEEIFSLLIRES